MTTKTCSLCREPFEALEVLSFTKCPACSAAAALEELTAYKAAATDRLEAAVDGRLQEMGLSRRERRATLGQVPVDIRRQLPREAVRALIEGRVPVEGFGLVGGQGVGKTMTLAAILKSYVLDRVTHAIAGLSTVPEPGAEPWLRESRVLWLSWPTVAAELKTMSAQDRGSQAVEDRVRRAMGVPLLVLDDLGRERMRGAYTEDYAVGQLDRIVDVRARDELPVIWTSNAGAREMERFYGGALVSRLVGLAPPVKLPALTDLRLSGAASAAA